jgi:hypothetical protein
MLHKEFTALFFAGLVRLDASKPFGDGDDVPHLNKSLHDLELSLAIVFAFEMIYCLN